MEALRENRSGGWRRRAPTAMPRFPSFPAALMLERFDLKGRPCGFGILAPQRFEVEHQLTQGQHHAYTCQQQDNDGRPNRPILGEEERRQDKQADERSEENALFCLNHYASIRNGLLE